MHSFKDLCFENSSDMLCRMQEGRFVEVSPSWQRTLGWTALDLTTRPFLDFVHPEDRPRTIVETENIFAGNPTPNFENRYYTKTGELRWLRWNCILCDEHVLAIARDVTDEMAREVTLEESQRQTRFFRILVETTRDPVYLISPANQFRMVYVNQAACEHFGKSKSEILQMSIPDWDKNYDFKRCEEIWAEIRRVRTCLVETVHTLDSGEQVPVEITANYIQFDQQEYIAGVIRDVRHRKALEEELEHFAYAASHDLQEPLRTLTSYLTLIEKKLPLDGEVAEYFRFATSSAAYMKQMIQGLLGYAKLGRHAVLRYPVSLTKVVEDVLRNLEKKLSESQAKVIVGDLPMVVGDPMLFYQIFQNLIDNAVKYRSRQPPEIRVEAQRSQSGWVVSVSDNGIGIPPEDSKRVFNVFQRLQGRDYPGVGIGLSTCKKAVELLDGRIRVEPNTPFGSRFVICLPDSMPLDIPAAEGRSVSR